MKRHRNFKRFVPQFSRLDVLFSSSTEPLSKAYRDLIIGRMRAGFEAIEAGNSPTIDNWRCCSDSVNLLEIIVGDGVAQDADGLLKDATNALAQCGQRAHAGHAMRMDGPGLHAVRSVLDDFEACMNCLSARYMKDVSNRADKIIWDANNGRPIAGVELVAI